MQLKNENALSLKFEEHISRLFPVHPFELYVDEGNFANLISQYLAMSIAFPYIQAGAIYRNYKEVISTNGDVNKNLEITSVIGSFLAWDEFGGHRLTKEYGDAGLQYLRDVKTNFHSNSLRLDINKLTGLKCKPHFSQCTVTYLDKLYEGLSDSCNNRNVAYMIAFEKHASIMINALWGAISRIFKIEKDDTLAYFYEHVGGDHPAEAFHVEMTQNMIEELIPREDYSRFLETCVEAYEVNLTWCLQLANRKIPLEVNIATLLGDA